MSSRFSRIGPSRLIFLDGNQSEVVEFRRFKEVPKQPKPKTDKSDQTGRSQDEKAWRSNP